MSRLTWSKWFWDAHSKRWRGHPLWMEGAWMRVLEQLHSSRKTGSMTRPVSSWAMIIGCSEEDADEFIHHIDKYDLAEIEYDEDVTITCRRMKKAALEKEKTAERQRKFRSKPKPAKKIKKKKPALPTSEERRSNMLEELRKMYHPNRAGLQPSIQKTELNKIMISASRTEAPANKGKIEVELFEKIKKHVEGLKETEVWDSEGRFVPGLGNFLKSRSWEFSNPKKDIKKIRPSETNNLWGA